MANNQPRNCEHFEQLISQSIDGEISVEENRELDGHLRDCDNCQVRKRNFAELNRLVCGIGAEQEPSGSGEFPQVHLSKPVKDNQTYQKPRLFLIGAFVAAASLAFVIFDFDGGAAREELDPDLVTPIVRLTEINSQRLHDQELMRESMEYELRTMKMQVKLADSELVDDYIERIEALLKKIERAKNPQLESYQEM